MLEEAHQSRRLLGMALITLFVTATAWADPVVPTESPNILNFGDFEGLTDPGNPLPWIEEGEQGTPPEDLQLFVGADANSPERGNVLFVDYARTFAGVRQNMVDVEVLPNTTYRASFDYRTPDFVPQGSAAGSIRFTGFLFGPAPIGTQFAPGPFVTTTSQWQTYEFEFTTFPNTDSVAFAILSGSDPNDPNFAGGISFEIDNCKLVQLRTPKRPETLVNNSGFEDAVADPNDPVPSWQVEGNPSTVISVVPDAHRGNGACRVEYSATFAGIRQPLNVAANDITPLGKYRLEFWYKSADPGVPAQFRVGIWEFSPSGNRLGTSPGITTSDEWQLFAYEVQLSLPDINFLRPVMQSVEASGAFLIDDVRLIEVQGPNLISNASFDDADPNDPMTLPASWGVSSAPRILSLTAMSEGNNNFIRIHADGNGGISQSFEFKRDTLYRVSCWYRASDPNDLKFSNANLEPFHMTVHDFGNNQGNRFHHVTYADTADPPDPNDVVLTTLAGKEIRLHDPNNYPGKNAHSRQNWLRFPSLTFRTRSETTSMQILITSQAQDAMFDIDDVTAVRLCDLADFDDDGDVDPADYQRFQDCFTAAQADPNDPNILIDQIPEGVACTDADMDEDQDVDEVDLAIFLECFSGNSGFAVAPEIGAYTFDDITGTGPAVGSALNPSGESGVLLSALGTGPLAAYTGVYGAVPDPNISDGFSFANQSGNDVLLWQRAVQGQPSHWGTPSNADTVVNEAGMNFTVTANGADVTVQGILIDCVEAPPYINAIQIAGGPLGLPVTSDDATDDNFALLDTPVTITDGNSETFTILWNSGAFGSLLEVDSISIRGTVVP